MDKLNFLLFCVYDQIIELFETKISDLFDLINILDDIKRNMLFKSDFKITSLKSDFHLIYNLINIFFNKKVSKLLLII
jgi:hypothetical protein